MMDLIEQKSDKIVAEMNEAIKQLDIRKAEAESIQIGGN